MMIRLAAAILLAGGVFSQPVMPTGPRLIEIDPSKPREVVAKLDGQSITAEEFQQLYVAMDAKAKEATKNDARATSAGSAAWALKPKSAASTNSTRLSSSWR
jgi:hypothetical protein